MDFDHADSVLSHSLMATAEESAVLGTFPSSPFSFRERIKASRCCAKGQRVEGVFKDEQGRYQVLKISSLADTEQCCTLSATLQTNKTGQSRELEVD